MNLDDLTDAWNALRNTTLGRGTAPRVPPALAAIIGARYERFRAERERAHALVDYSGLPVWAYSEYNDSVRRARAALPEADLPPNAEPLLEAAIDRLTEAGRTVGLLALAYVAWRAFSPK